MPSTSCVCSARVLREPRQGIMEGDVTDCGNRANLNAPPDGLRDADERDPEQETRLWSHIVVLRMEQRHDAGRGASRTNGHAAENVVSPPSYPHQLSPAPSGGNETRPSQGREKRVSWAFPCVLSDNLWCARDDELRRGDSVCRMIHLLRQVAFVRPNSARTVSSPSAAWAALPRSSW